MKNLKIDHSKNTIPAALGIPDKRAKEIQRYFIKFTSDERQTEWKRSTYMEKVFEFAQTEAEQVYLAYCMGCSSTLSTILSNH